MKKLVVFGAILLGGCTTALSTRPVPAGIQGTIGIPYSLPALRYRADITRTLSECAVVGNDLVLKFDVTVDPKPTYVDGEEFVIDYRDLAAPTKTSTFKVEFFDGTHMIKTVNVEADDKSPEIVAGVIKAGFSVARLASGLPAAAGDIGGGVPKPRKCPVILGERQRIIDAIEIQTEDLSDLTSELEPYTVTALIATLTDPDKAKISVLRVNIGAVSGTIAELRKKLADYDKALARTDVVDLNFTTGKLDETLEFPSRDSAVADAQRKWLVGIFGALSDKELGKLNGDIGSLVATLRAVRTAENSKQICIDAGLSNCTAVVPKWSASGDGSRPDGIPGIAFRQPTPSRFRVCQGTDANACASAAVKVVSENEAVAPQLGRLMILPFKNGFGENNQLQAEFRKDGALSSVMYAEKRSSALAAVNTLNDALDQGLDFAGARRAKREADAAAVKTKAEAAATTELTSVQNQLALLKARAEVLSAQAAMDPANIAIANQQTLLNSQVAQLQAQVTIKELLTKLQP